MPRNYKCRKCEVQHAPPTGKHCRQAVLEENEHSDEDVVGTGHDKPQSEGIMTIMRDLQRQMLEMQQKMANGGVDGARSEANQSSPTSSPRNHASVSPQGAEAAVPAADIKPATLRQNTSLMRQANDRP